MKSIDIFLYCRRKAPRLIQSKLASKNLFPHLVCLRAACLGDSLNTHSPYLLTYTRHLFSNNTVPWSLANEESRSKLVFLSLLSFRRAMAELPELVNDESGRGRKRSITTATPTRRDSDCGKELRMCRLEIDTHGKVCSCNIHRRRWN